MKISLAFATRGSDKEGLERLFRSLDEQTYRDFELVVVDREIGGHARRLSDEYAGRFRIKYITCDISILCVARNIGLENSDGVIIGLPEDDGHYPPELLENVARFFEEHAEYGVLSAAPVDADTGLVIGNSYEKSTEIPLSGVFHAGIGHSLFFRNDGSLPRFDEQFGIGVEFGCTDETDFLTRVMANGARAYYSREITVLHPDKNARAGWVDFDRERVYSRGFGGFFRKHVYYARRFELLGTALKLLLFRPLGGIVYGIVTARPETVRFYAVRLSGRLKGFLDYNRRNFEISERFSRAKDR